MFMRMISGLIFTFSRPKGWVALQLSLVGRPSSPGWARATASQAPMPSAGPARHRLMPSSASSTVPRTPCAWAVSNSRWRKAGRSARGTKR